MLCPLLVCTQPSYEYVYIGKEAIAENTIDMFRSFFSSLQIIVDKKQQNVKFLSDIKTRGPKAFGVLVQALRHTSQEHLADILDPAREFSIPQESSYNSVSSTHHLVSGGTASLHESYDGSPANSLSNGMYMFLFRNLMGMVMKGLKTFYIF